MKKHNIKNIMFANLTYKEITDIILDNPNSVIIKVDSEDKPRFYDLNNTIPMMKDLIEIEGKSFVIYPAGCIEKRYNFADIIYNGDGDEVSTYYTQPDIIGIQEASRNFQEVAGKFIISTICHSPIKPTLLCVNQDTKQINFLFHTDAQNDEQGERDAAAIQSVEQSILMDIGLMTKGAVVQIMQTLGIDKMVEAAAQANSN